MWMSLNKAKRPASWFVCLFSCPDIAIGCIKCIYSLKTLKSMMKLCLEEMSEHLHGKWLLYRLRVQYVKVFVFVKELLAAHESYFAKCHYCAHEIQEDRLGLFEHTSLHIKNLIRDFNARRSYTCLACNRNVGDFDCYSAV